MIKFIPNKKKIDFYPSNDQRSKNITHSVRAQLLLLDMAA